MLHLTGAMPTSKKNVLNTSLKLIKCRTSPMSTEETTVAYLGAVSTSIALSLGLSRIARNMPDSPRTRLLKSMTPFMTVAAANIVNVFMMRGKEIRQVKITGEFLIDT